MIFFICYFCSHYGFMITSLTWVKFHWFIDHFLFNKGTHGTVPFRGNQKEKIVLLGWETLNCDLRTVFPSRHTDQKCTYKTFIKGRSYLVQFGNMERRPNRNVLWTFDVVRLKDVFRSLIFFLPYSLENKNYKDKY